MFYELNLWPKNPLDNFILKNCLFDATNIVKNSNKSKWVYSGYWIVFDGKGEGDLVIVLPEML